MVVYHDLTANLLRNNVGNLFRDSIPYKSMGGVQLHFVGCHEYPYTQPRAALEDQHVQDVSRDNHNGIYIDSRL